MRDYEILIAEDDESILNSIEIYLKNNDRYKTTGVSNGLDALEETKKKDYDLVIMDLMMPGMTGEDAIREIRRYSVVPILILSAKSEDLDKIMGLTLGADDYLTKPFSFDELEARVRSLTRRKFKQEDPLLVCGDLSFDTLSRTAKAKGQVLKLTRKEAGILEYLLLHQGSIVSQEDLISHIWDENVDPFSNSIRVHMSSLRKKIRQVLQTDPIRNKIGQGYVLEEKQ